MRNKIIIVLLCSLIVICINGCENNKNEKSQLTQTEQKPKNRTLDKKIKCEALSKVKYSIRGRDHNYGYFITNDNDFYEFNIETKYSNNTNCKKINEGTLKIEKYLSLDSTIYVLGNNNNIYVYANDVLKPFDITTSKTKYLSDSLKLMKDTDVEIQNYQYVLKNGKIYYSPPTYQKDLTLYKEFENEKIIDFDSSIFIKTDKAFYLYTKLYNSAQCENDSDLYCGHDYIKNNVLTSNYDDISIYISTGTAYPMDGGNKYLVHEIISKNGEIYYLNDKED